MTALDLTKKTVTITIHHELDTKDLRDRLVEIIGETAEFSQDQLKDFIHVLLQRDLKDLLSSDYVNVDIK